MNKLCAANYASRSARGERSEAASVRGSLQCRLNTEPATGWVGRLWPQLLGGISVCSLPAAPATGWELLEQWSKARLYRARPPINLASEERGDGSFLLNLNIDTVLSFPFPSHCVLAVPSCQESGWISNAFCVILFIYGSRRSCDLLSLLS